MVRVRVASFCLLVADFVDSLPFNSRKRSLRLDQRRRFPSLFMTRGLGLEAWPPIFLSAKTQFRLSLISHTLKRIDHLRLEIH